MNKTGTGPERSKADFVFCMTALRWGHSLEAVEAELMRVSELAQERHGRGDTGYARITAQNANAALDRERGQKQFFNRRPQAHVNAGCAQRLWDDLCPPELLKTHQRAFKREILTRFPVKPMKPV